MTLLDALVAASVVSAGVNAPPTAPQNGQCWIVGSIPLGEWADQAHALACWTSGGWRFVAARPGMRVWVGDQQLWAERVDAGWRFGDVVGLRLLVGGEQVVGARLPTVAAPDGGAVQDLEARSAVATLIARLTSHGLIAS